MRIEISSTEAVRRFGDCLARIKYRGDSFIITRNAEAVAELVPVAGARRASWGEIRQALAGPPRDAGFGDDLESVNQSDQPASNPWA
jgi:antitoxin (DNA-binding transcriptional repressor) of toxin-antitoxin stability system